MRTKLTLKPGQNGTKKLLADYGERLVCVRYHYDDINKRRLKTVELVVDEIPWTAERPARYLPEEKVCVRVAFSEHELRNWVRLHGGVWDSKKRLWEIAWKSVKILGIEDRVVDG